MSKVYKQINSIAGVNGAVFGGGGGGGSRKKNRKKSTTSHLDRVETQIKLGGGPSHVDKDYPYSSYNVSHNNGTRKKRDNSNIEGSVCSWTSVQTPGGGGQSSVTTCQNLSSGTKTVTTCVGGGVSFGVATTGGGACFTETYQ